MLYIVYFLRKYKIILAVPFFSILFFDLSECITLKKLGNLVVRHDFRQANIVANILSRLGSKLTMTDQPLILITPPNVVIDQLKTDQNGELSSKLVLRSTCNKLACFGNLSVIASTNSDNVLSDV